MTIKKVFIVLFFAALFITGIAPTIDPDMWWHLKTGQLILQKGIPSADVFSFTVLGREWTAHEWLSEVILWLIFRNGGLQGIIFWTALLSFLTFGLVYKNCRRGKPYVAGLSVLLSAVTATIGWSAGPKLFTYFLAAVFLYILENWRDGKASSRQLLLFPLFSVLWVNLHGGYILGLTLILIYFVGGVWERRPSLVRLGIMGGISFFLTAFNPSGWHIWIYPFLQMTSPAQRLYITEWQSPNFHSIATWPFMLMFGVCFFFVVKDRRQLAATPMVLFAGSAGMAFLSIRHIPLFAVLNAPLLCRAASNILEEKGLKEIVSPASRDTRVALLNHVLNTAILTGVLLFILVNSVRRVGSNDHEIAKIFPVTAVDYLKNQGLDRKRGYNDYDFGGYLIWKDIPVFIDGRADMYGDAYLNKYFDTLRLKEKWRSTLDEYKIEYAILAKDRALCALLKESPVWKEVYRDNVARIFVRNP